MLGDKSRSTAGKHQGRGDLRMTVESLNLKVTGLYSIYHHGVFQPVGSLNRRITGLCSIYHHGVFQPVHPLVLHENIGVPSQLCTHEPQGCLDKQQADSLGAYFKSKQNTERPQKGNPHFEEDPRSQAVFKCLYSFGGPSVIPFCLFMFCIS